KSVADLKPAGRIVAIKGVESAQAAREAGCNTYGANDGSGFNSVLVLGGGLEQHLMPVHGNFIRLIFLAYLLRWRSDAEAAAIDLRFARGTLEADGSFVAQLDDSAPTDRWGAAFDGASLEAGWLETGEQPFELPVPIFGEFMGHMQLDGGRFVGRL